MARIDSFPCPTCCGGSTSNGECDCQYCPNGVPAAWIINLAGFTDGTCECEELNLGEVILRRPVEPWTGGGFCYWDANVDLGAGRSLNIHLALNGVSWELSLFVSDGGVGGLICGGSPGGFAVTWAAAFADVCCETVTLTHSGVIGAICDLGPATIDVVPYEPATGMCEPCGEDCPEGIADDCDAHPLIRVPCCANALPCVLNFEIVDASCTVGITTGTLRYSHRQDGPGDDVYCYWNFDFGRIGDDPDCPETGDNLYAAALTCHTTGGLSSWELGGNNINNSNSFSGVLVSVTCDPFELVAQITIPAINDCPECTFTIIITE